MKLLLTLALTILFFSLFADNIETNDGKIIEGAILGATQNPYITYQRVEMSDGEFIEFAIVAPEFTEPGMAHPALLAFPPGNHTKSEAQWALDKYWIRQSIQRNWIVISPLAFKKQAYYQGPEKYIPELMDWVEEKYEVEDGKFHASGISNGGKSAFQVAIKFRTRIASLLVFPGILIDSEDENIQLDSLVGMPVHMYVGEGESEEWTNAMDSIKVILDSLGVENQYKIFQGEGHVIQSLTSEMLFDTLDTFRP